MRELLGFLTLNIGLLLTGLALLIGLGLVRSLGDGVRLGGLGLLTGWALTGIWVSVALVVGLAPTPASVAIFWGIALVGALVVARWVPRRREVRCREPRLEGRVAALGGVLLLASYLAMLGLAAYMAVGFHPDVWTFWQPKAKSIYYFGGLDTGVGGFTSYVSPDYPPLRPGLDALLFHFLGRPDVYAVPFQAFIVDLAFFAGVAGLLAPRVRPAVLWPSLAILPFGAGYTRLIGSGLVDESVAALIGLAGVIGIVWLYDRDQRYLVLLGVTIAAATLTKNEGLMLSLVLVGSLAVAARKRSALRPLAALAVAPIAAHYLWKAWLAANDVPPNYAYDFRRFLRPGELIDHADDLGYGTRAMVEQLGSPSRWLLLVPLTLVLAGFAARRRLDVSVFVATAAVLSFAGFAMTYWANTVQFDIADYVGTNADRIVVSIVVLCGTAFPVLLGHALGSSSVDAAAVAGADLRGLDETNNPDPPINGTEPNPPALRRVTSG